MPGPYRYLLALLLGTIVLDYYLGIWIEQTEEPWKRKALVIVSLCSNLGILVFFKYTDFFTQDVLHLAGEASPSDPAGRHLVPHVPVAVLHDRRLSQAAPRDALGRPVRDVRAVLPAARRRPDRARAGPAAAARGAAGARAREGHARPVPHRRRPVQEDRARRCPGARDRRPRVRGAGAVLGGRGRSRASTATRCRSTSTSRRTPTSRSARRRCSGSTLPENFRTPYRSRQPPGVLAALAHHAVDVAARLPLHHARRQPRRAVADVRQSDHDDAPRRAVARRELGVHRVGRAPRLRARGDALLPACDRRPSARSVVVARRLRRARGVRDRDPRARCSRTPARGGSSSRCGCT